MIECCEQCPTGPTEKPTDIDRKPKAQLRTELTTVFPKIQNKPKWYFHGKAHSSGQTYICPDLIKQSLGKK